MPSCMQVCMLLSTAREVCMTRTRLLCPFSSLPESSVCSDIELLPSEASLVRGLCLLRSFSFKSSHLGLGFLSSVSTPVLRLALEEGRGEEMFGKCR